MKRGIVGIPETAETPKANTNSHDYGLRGRSPQCV